jgi:Protein of unknown function (DUF2934)
MARAKTPRTPKPKPEDKVLRMPDNGGNGEANHSGANLESEIRLRAYQIYEERGYTNGRADDDWFEAEQQILARYGNQKHTA